jgi:hypothetical protein
MSFKNLTIKIKIMKNRFKVLAVLAFAASLILSACSSSAKKAEESHANIDSAGQSSAARVDTVNAFKADWDKFKADASDKVRQNEDSLQAIKMRVSKTDAKVKAASNKELARLEEKNNEMKMRLNNYKAEGDIKWEKFKTDFTNSMDTLDKDIKRVL